MSGAKKFIYLITFQIGWFVCVLTNSWISLGYTIGILILHFIILANTSTVFLPRKEILWILLVFLLGFILETISFSAGFIYLHSPVNFFEHLKFPPLWLLNLWVLFSIATRTCLSFVFYNPKLAYLLSSIAIPLNYYAGSKLNTEVAVNDPYMLSLALITLLWIGLLGLLIQLQRHYFGDMFNAN